MLCILTDVSTEIITHLRLAKRLKSFFLHTVLYRNYHHHHHPRRLFHLNISPLVGHFYIIRTTYYINTFRE